MFTYSISIPDAQAILIIACILLLVAVVCQPRSASTVPGPRGWPLLGNALSIGRDAHLSFTAWAEQYGSVLGVKIGPMLVVVLNDLQTIENAFSAHSVLNDRPVPGLLKVAFSNKGSLLWENGRDWVKNRKFVLRSLYRFKRYRLSELILTGSKQLYGVINNADGLPIDVCRPINMAVSNMICALCFGRNFDYDDDNFQRLLTDLQALVQSVSGTALGHFIPWLYYTPLYRTFRQLAENVTRFIDNEIDQHRKTFDSANARDLIDEFLNEELNTGGGECSYHGHTRRAVIDMFASGTDTISTALSWAILYMTQYTENQIAVQREIDTVIVENRLPTLTDYHNLPYTRATLMEVLRHANVAPLGLPRSASSPTTINGHCILTGTWVFANVWSVHHDTRYWDTPEAFQPERFLSDDRSTVLNIKAFMPFGLGQRVCIGKTVAMSSMVVFFSMLLQQFSFSIPQQDPKPSLRGINGLTLAPETFRVNAIRRHHKTNIYKTHKSYFIHPSTKEIESKH